MPDHPTNVRADLAHVDAPSSAAPALATVSELCALINRHPNSIRKDIRAGRIPHYQIGGSVRFDVREVLAALHCSPNK